MSVWNYGITKFNLAYNIYINLPAQIDSILGDNPEKYFGACYEQVNVELADTWEDFALIHNWKVTQYEDMGELIEFLRLPDVTKWHAGVSAIYFIIDLVMKDDFCAGDLYGWDNISATMGLIGQLIMPSTQITPNAFMNAFSYRNKDYERIAEKLSSVAYGFRKVIRSMAPDKLKQIRQNDAFGDASRYLFGYTVGNILIMKGAKRWSQHAIVMARVQVSQLIDCMERLANAFYYLAYNSTLPNDVASAIQWMVLRTIRCGVSASPSNVNKVVKAFHKSRALIQMILFKNENDMAFEEELKDYKDDALHMLLNHEEILEILKPIPTLYWYEVLQVYKWMPPAEFDSARMVLDLKDWHNNPRPSGLDPGCSTEMRDLYQRIVFERKVNLASAYHAAHNEWPASLCPTDTNPTKHQYEAWDVTGTLPYFQYGKDIVNQIKDKTIPASTISKELYGKKDLDDRSFLIWYMRNAGSIDTVNDLKDLAGGILPEENFSKVSIKWEAHKEHGRAFFMAPPRQRILLGELEGNLARVARTYPASLQGKSSQAKVKILNKLMDTDIEPAGASVDEMFTIYLVMFDCTKFSPKSNYNVTKDYTDFWARVYKMPDLESTINIGPNSTIVYHEGPMLLKYNNKGADLEGYRGRMQTMFHADMLAAACRLANEENTITGKGVLAVFIDDGVVKVAVMGEGEVARSNVNKFLSAMKRIYASAGQDNNPSKTIISQVGAEMLATQFVNGVRLPTGIKAFMKIIPATDQPAISLPDEMDGLFSSAQGAVKDGADWICTYKMYIHSVLRSISRWSNKVFRRLDYEDLAFKLLTPKSFGGFSLRNFQALVTTAAVNMTAEGFGVLNRIGRTYKAYRRRIKRILTKKLVNREPLQIMRDPDRLRAEGDVMVENRLLMAIIKELDSSKLNMTNFMSGYKSQELIDHATAVAKSLLGGKTVSIPVITRTWKVTPLSYVETVVSKFKRAATVIGMLGFKKIGSIRQRNAEDVRMILTQ